MLSIRNHYRKLSSIITDMFSTGGLTLNFTKNCPKYIVMNVNVHCNETHLYYNTTFL